MAQFVTKRASFKVSKLLLYFFDWFCGEHAGQGRWLVLLFFFLDLLLQLVLEEVFEEARIPKHPLHVEIPDIILDLLFRLYLSLI